MQDLPGATPGPLRGSSHRFPFLGWLMALVWGGFIAGLFVADLRPSRGVAPWIAWGAAGLFALPGIFFLWSSVSSTLRFFRYRSLELILDQLPARTGGPLSGTLEVPVPYDAAHSFRARLTATEYKRTQAGSRGILQHLMVQEEVEAQATPGSRGTQLRFALRIPDAAPPSQGYGERLIWTHATRTRVFLRWTIEISAEVPGVDLQEEFEIPVRQATAAEAAVSAQAPFGLSPVRAPRRPSYESAEEGGRLVIRQPAWNKPGTPLSHVFVLAAFFGMFFLVGIGVAWLGAWPVGLVFMLIGLVFSGGVVVTAGSALRADISREGVQIGSTLLGLRLKRVSLDPARIAAVEVRVDSAPGGGAPSRSVSVRESGGAVHRIAEFIPSTGEAEALRDKVIARLGKSPGAGEDEAGRAAASAGAQRDEPRSGWRKQVPGAIIVGAFALYSAHSVRPDWFSFSGPAQLPAPQTQPAAATAKVRSPADRINDAIALSSRAEGRGDLKNGIRELENGLQLERALNGPDHPMEAYLLNIRARLEIRAKDDAAAERSLIEAVRIMEIRPAADTRRLLGNRGGELDRERLAFSAGEFFWDRRRYAEAHAYFVKAWDAALDLGLDESEINFRRANSSARVMATACALANWELADKAMAELKERYGRVTPSAREGLKYWIDTGEPRLKARKC